MTNRQKLKKIQKIIDKYIDVLETLPAGGEIDEQLARKLGIPNELKSFIDRSFKLGKLKGKTRARINLKDIENHFDKLSNKDNEFVNLYSFESEQDISNILQKQRTKLSRLSVEVLKRKMNLVEDTFKDEPIPRRWLAGELRKITGDTKQDWDMVIRTELVNSQQEGMARSIIDGTSPYSVDGGDTIVFKRPNHDACKHCIKHYLEKDRVTPKLFKLSELMVNGTNYGKKVQDWKATLGVMHPHCQCQLQVMPKGCKFDENGRIIIDKKVRR